LFFVVCRCTPILHLCGGGVREKKKQKRNSNGSSSRWVLDGDDPMDSDFDLKEEMRSKKKPQFLVRSKRARKTMPDPTPSGSDDDNNNDEEEDEDDSEDGNEEEGSGEEEEESADEGLEYNP
jgi:hypothetical protein